jgi:hypothetical protein
MVLIGIVSLLLLTSINSFASLDQFAGYWTNVDPNTRGIVALDIAVEGSSANVQAWGSCHPTPCDWGTVAANAFATDVSSDISNAAAMTAVFDSGFSETTLVISPSGDQLKVESYDRFKDNSGRSNYVSTYSFNRVANISMLKPIKLVSAYIPLQGLIKK